MADLARIKRNVSKMVSAGAPETEIDAYIEMEGVTVEDVRSFSATASAPEALVPGSPAYAQWAAEQARAGKKLPQVSQHTEFQNTGQEKYGSQLELIRRRYYPDLTDEQWQKAIAEPMTNLQPHSAGDLFAEGMRWNLGDEARGAAGAVTNLTNDPGRAFQDYQRFEQARRAAGQEQAGLLGTGAEIAGAVMSGGPVSGLTRPTVGQAAVDAAKQGGAYGFLASEGDLVDRGTGATIGAATGAVLGAGAQKADDVLTQRAATKAAVRGAPTAQQVRQSSKSAFRQMENSGAVIQQPALNLLNHDMKQLMRAEGIVRPSGKVDTSYSRIVGALDTIDDFASAPLGMKEAQTVWKSLRRAAGSSDPQEAQLGVKMLDLFEDWMDNLPPQAGTGNIREAFNAWTKGKSDWARFRKTQTIETAIGKAARAKGGFAAGLRSQFNRILDNPKRQRGFTKAELEAMKKSADGGPIENVIGFLGGLRGILGAAGVTALGGGPVGLAMLGAGFGGKMALNRGARGVAERMRAQAALPGGIPHLPLPANSIFQDLARRGIRGFQSQLVGDE